MKSSYEENKKNTDPNKYPILKKHCKKELIVLFVGKSKGIIVFSDEFPFYAPITGHYDEWIEEEFTEFHGTVTLEN